MNLRVIALKVRRRSIAAAVFSGRTLEYTESLQLCDEPDGAAETTARFLASLLERFEPDAAAIGIGTARQGSRVKSLIEIAERMLLADGIPFESVKDKALLERYAIPKLKNTRQLRPIMQAFWPQLEQRQLTAYEAMALGFYVQIERLLSQI